MCECEEAVNRMKKLRFEWVLVVVEIALSVWTYYVYVWLVCIQTTHEPVETILLLSAFHPLLLMTAWSFLRTLLTPRISVPPEFHVSALAWDRIEHDTKLKQETRRLLGIKTTTSSDDSFKLLNYCYACRNIKPDRCHHCSRCEACVLRMDHHCPWLNRCVGFHNHKFFILFLHYMFAFCVFLVITCSGVLPRIWRRDWVGYGSNVTQNEEADLTSQNTTATFILPEGSLSEKSASLRVTATSSTVTETSIPAAVTVSGPSATTVAAAAAAVSGPSATTAAAAAATAGTQASLVAGTGLSAAFLQVLVLVLICAAFLFSLVPLLHMHAELMAGNITTLEQFRPLGLPGGTFSTSLFDLGSVSANHREIMGPQLWLWPIPVFTSQGDGVHFPVCGCREEEGEGKTGGRS